MNKTKGKHALADSMLLKNNPPGLTLAVGQTITLTLKTKKDTTNEIPRSLRVFITQKIQRQKNLWSIEGVVQTAKVEGYIISISKYGKTETKVDFHEPDTP